MMEGSMPQFAPHDNPAAFSGYSFTRLETSPVNTKHCSTIGLILDQRLRRWASSEPTLGHQLIVFVCHTIQS